MDTVTLRILIWAISLGSVATLFVVAGSKHLTNVTNILQGTLGVLAAAAPRMLAGGGAAAASNIRSDIYPWRTWPVIPILGQLTQTLPAGAEEATWYNDCGETCCAMVIAACRGVRVMGDALRALLLPNDTTGLTTGAQLLLILAACHIDAREVMAGGDSGVSLVQTATQDGRPVICLGVWPTPGGVNHWILATSVDSEKVYYINPWGGVRSWLTHSDWKQYSLNDYVVLDSHLLFG